MKLFDLNQQEKQEFRRLFFWHLGYITLIAIFFSVIYYFGFFKSTSWLKEGPIFTQIAPVTTAIFVRLSPWWGAWKGALLNTYRTLGGEAVFCVMATVVFCFGFFIYSIFLWSMGALPPSIFYI